MKQTDSLNFKKHFMDNILFLEKYFRLQHLISGNKTHAQDFANQNGITQLKQFFLNSSDAITFSEQSHVQHQFFQYLIQSEMVEQKNKKKDAKTLHQKQMLDGSLKQSYDNTRHLVNQFVTLKMLESDRYDSFQRSLTFRNSKMRKG